MPIKNFFVLCIVTSQLFSQSTWGWGLFAHKSIALIAEKQLTSQARQNVSAILGTETLAEASTWADNIRSSPNWKHTKYYHYKNIGDVDFFQSLEDISETERKKGDVLRAVLRAEDTLRDSNTSAENKKTALRFLIHFIGDLHQPLHLGYKHDGGGNDVSLKWYGKNTNLHSLWDSGLINTFLKKSSTNSKPTPQDFIQLLPSPSGQQLQQWKKSSPLDWFNESLKNRDEAYKGYSGDNDEYYKKSSSIMQQRILQAGYRLAFLLNSISLQSDSLTQDSVQLRDNILPFVNFDPFYQIQLTQKEKR